MKYIISLVAALLLLGCSSEQKHSEEATDTSPATTIVETIQTKTADAAKQVSAHVEEGAKAAKQKSQELLDEAAQSAEEAQKSVADVSQDITEEIAKTSQDIQNKVADTTEKISNELQQTTQEIQNAVASQHTASQEDGATLFKRKCSSCHGAAAEKAALGKSQIIKGWDAGKVITALQGYQEGSYGGAMKGLMASQVASLTQEDMEALAAFISKQ